MWFSTFLYYYADVVDNIVKITKYAEFLHISLMDKFKTKLTIDKRNLDYYFAITNEVTKFNFENKELTFDKIDLNIKKVKNKIFINVELFLHSTLKYVFSLDFMYIENIKMLIFDGTKNIIVEDIMSNKIDLINKLRFE